MSELAFAARLLRWHARHGRHDLPWQHPRSAYRVWISEVMLQQTQVATVVPYFERFIARFPDLRTLAAAPLDDVLAHWSGLGYYSRARNLHRAAVQCLTQHGGKLPETLDDWISLPGVGRSTAAAILSQACGQRAAILDGNVRRVLARHAGIDGDPASPAIQRRLWALAESRLPDDDFANYTQALMDFGATCCTPRRPSCSACPVRTDCVALATDRIDRLPTPKSRAAAPVRSVVMLALHATDGRILLVKRPPTGIWGGLWSLPEFDTPNAAQNFAAQIGDIDHTPLVGATYRHTFTHFKLDIAPCRIDLTGVVQRIPDAHDWFDPASISNLALPTAVRRVLERLRLAATSR